MDVEARALGFKWSRRSARFLGIAGSFLSSEAESERIILRDVNVRFPAGEVTAILVRRVYFVSTCDSRRFYPDAVV